VIGCLGQDGTPGPAGDLYIDGINDQHAYVRRRSGESVRGKLAVADTVRLGISHPCTTFDRWRCIVAVDDDDRIVAVVRTLFC
jgi:D-serine deaminase-like pyridoxal phosphate-dependent protein